MESRDNVQVDVVWKPYQLDPNTAVDGETFHSYCQRRWGGSSWTNHLRMEGIKDGCTFSNWKYWPNTLRAHQWVQYGVDHNLSDTDRMNAALFRALYEDGQNISSVDTLVSLGVELFQMDNFDPNHLREYLQNNRGNTVVQQEIAALRRKYKVRGVPSFQIGVLEDASSEFKSSCSLSGAQQANAFCEVFQELVAE